MVKLLKDKFGIEVSEGTSRRTMQEHYIELKICSKIHEKSKKRLDWCRGNLNKYWHNILFSDQTTVYVDNPSGFK